MESTDQLKLFRLKNARKPFVKLNSTQVLRALKKLFPPGTNWVFLTEVAFATGQVHGSDNHIDAMAFNCWPSEGLDRYAFEVKVSREDFKKELRNPKKRRRAVEYSNFFYFATPQGLVHEEDLPPEAGLIEVDEKEESRIVVKADYRKEPKFSFPFFLAALRNAQALTMYRQSRYREFLESMQSTLFGFPDVFETEEEAIQRIIQERKNA